MRDIFPQIQAQTQGLSMSVPAPSSRFASLCISAAPSQYRHPCTASASCCWLNAGNQDAFMQLVTEQLGGSVFNFQGSAQSSYCSSNEEMLSHPGASFSYSAESFTSNLFQQPYHLRPGGWHAPATDQSHATVCLHISSWFHMSHCSASQPLICKTTCMQAILAENKMTFSDAHHGPAQTVRWQSIP